MSTQRFTTQVVQTKTGAYVVLPFDPNEVWGVKERHYVSGSIHDRPFRGCLDCEVTPCVLPIGAAWIRDNELGDGVNIEIILAPDGHQVGTVSPDIAAALNANPQARAFFESVAPFYRNNYIRWIEEARRPETRDRRIAEMIKLLEAGEKRL